VPGQSSTRAVFMGCGAATQRPTNTMSQEQLFTLVVVRHGESEWNKSGLFTGWADPDLTETGMAEAKSGAAFLKEKGFEFDLAYTSVLKRAIKTLNIVQDEMNLHWIPVRRRWRLNERHYGGLTGRNKKETAKEHGDKQVHIWRRSYDTPPPPLDKSSKYYPGNDRRYKGVEEKFLPTCECLKDTVARVLPLWNEEIVPEIKKGTRILIAAHGNSLRALVKHLDKISDDEIAGYNIPTGVPLVYKLDGNMQPVKKYYLEDEEKLKAKMEAVANQGKAAK